MLLNKIQNFVVFVLRRLAKLTQQTSRASKRIRSSVAIATLVTTAVLAGHVAPPPVVTLAGLCS